MNRRKLKKAFIETIKEMFVVFIFTIAGCLIATFSNAITGTIAYGLLKKELDEKIHELSTGTIIEF